MQKRLGKTRDRNPDLLSLKRETPEHCFGVLISISSLNESVMSTTLCGQSASRYNRRDAKAITLT
jgi:hypothetical protein